jgi:hypothetical protein
MVKLSRNNLRHRNRRSHTRTGGLFSSPTCPEGQFLNDGKECLTVCPEGSHGDTNCHPHECVSGRRDSWYNRTRAASCVKGRALKEYTSSKLHDLTEFTQSKAQLAKAKWQRERYEWSKRYVELYEAAQAGHQDSIVKLDTIQEHEETQQNDVIQQAVDEAKEEVRSETQEMIDTAAAAVKEEVRQEVVAEVQAETQAVVDEAASAAAVAAKAANDAAEQAQAAANALANIAQPDSVKAAGRSSRRRRY